MSLVGPASSRSTRALPLVRDLLHPVAGLGKGAEHVQGPGRGVEADAVADPAVAVGIVGEHQRDPPLRRRLAAQPAPGGGKAADEVDPVGHRDVLDEVGLGERIAVRLPLEGDGAREDPPVHLGQRHVHGDVARRKAVGPLPPGGLGGGREHHLQHRAVAGRERGLRGFAAGGGDGEAGRVQDHVRRRFGEDAFENGCRNRVLEARGEQRQRVHPALLQPRNQGIDRGKVPRLHQGAVEDDGGDRTSVLPAGAKGGELARPITRARCAGVDPGAEQRLRLAPLARPPDQRGGEAQELGGVVDAAVDQVLPQPVPGLGGDGGKLGELGVGLIVAGKERDGDAPFGRHRGDLLDPVRPVAAAAEQAHDDQPGLAGDRIDEGIHRQVVAQAEQVGEPEARLPLVLCGEPAPAPRRGRRSRCPPPKARRCRPVSGPGRRRTSHRRFPRAGSRAGASAQPAALTPTIPARPRAPRSPRRRRCRVRR